MKIIGTTTAGVKLIVVSTEEVIALAAAGQVLAGIGAIIPAQSEADKDLQEWKAAELLKARIKICEELRGKGKKRGHATSASPTKSLEPRICLLCTKPLPRNAHPSMKTHNGKCKKMYAREYARKHWREKNGKPEAVMPAGNPAAPALTDAERKAVEEMKAKRMADIARICKSTAGN